MISDVRWGCHDENSSTLCFDTGWDGLDQHDDDDDDGVVYMFEFLLDEQALQSITKRTDRGMGGGGEERGGRGEFLCCSNR